MKHRIRLDGQLIPRKMRRLAGDGRKQVRFGAEQGLSWQTVHQVQIETVEASLTREINRGIGLIAGVYAS